MALFAVNTGCRDQEICLLRWKWETKVPELNTSVFVVPGESVKNGEDRLIVLNKVAQSVINEVRSLDSEYVFTYRGKPTTRMLNSGWKKARKEANLNVRVHDLKHTFGRRLRASGISFEDRQDLLGHKSGRITTHYSAAEIGNLIRAADKICENNDLHSPTLTLLRSMNAGLIPVKVKAERSCINKIYTNRKLYKNSAPAKVPQIDSEEIKKLRESQDRQGGARSSAG